MTLYRADVPDTPDDPFCGGRLRADADAGLLDPELCSPLEVGLRHAVVTADTLANVFALATSADSARVWVDGADVNSSAVWKPDTVWRICDHCSLESL